MTKIILEENCDGHGGFISVDKEALLMKVSERFPDDETIPEQFRNMTLIAWIKSDLDGRHIFYKKYQDKLRKAGFDI